MSKVGVVFHRVQQPPLSFGLAFGSALRLDALWRANSVALAFLTFLYRDRHSIFFSTAASSFTINSPTSWSVRGFLQKSPKDCFFFDFFFIALFPVVNPNHSDKIVPLCLHRTVVSSGTSASFIRVTGIGLESKRLTE